jgi:hypothetical protein
VGIRGSGSAVAGGHLPSDDPRRPADTHLLRSRQQAPSRQIQIRQAAGDKEPGGILCQPTVADFGPPKELLDHQEHLFDFGTDRRFGPVTGALRFTQRSRCRGAVAPACSVRICQRAIPMCPTLERCKRPSDSFQRHRNAGTTMNRIANNGYHINAAIESCPCLFSWTRQY